MKSFWSIIDIEMLNAVGESYAMANARREVKDAAKYIDRIRACGICADYLCDDVLGKDAHTVVCNVNNILEFITCI